MNENTVNEVIETTEIIQGIGMKGFVEAVVKFYENPENQRKFEEWLKNEGRNL